MQVSATPTFLPSSGVSIGRGQYNWMPNSNNCVYCHLVVKGQSWEAMPFDQLEVLRSSLAASFGGVELHNQDSKVAVLGLLPWAHNTDAWLGNLF